MGKSSKWGVVFKHTRIYVDRLEDDGKALQIQYDYIVDIELRRESNGNGEYRFKFFDKENQLSNIEKKGWIASPIVDVPFNWSGFYPIVNYVDPKGNSRAIKSLGGSTSAFKHSGFDEEIVYVFDKLDQLCLFADWEHYDLYLEKLELEKTVLKLKEKIAELKEKLANADM